MFIKKGFLCEALAVPELTLYSRLGHKLTEIHLSISRILGLKESITTARHIAIFFVNKVH